MTKRPGTVEFSAYLTGYLYGLESRWEMGMTEKKRGDYLEHLEEIASTIESEESSLEGDARTHLMEEKSRVKFHIMMLRGWKRSNRGAES